MKKKLRIVREEPWLLMAIPISLVSLSLILILRPLIKIRVGFLRCDRLGHFGANTELYLCERDVNNIQTLDLFYYPRKACNQQLATMWERKLIVLPWFLLRPLDLIIRSFPVLAPLHAAEGKGGDRDIYNLLDRLPPHLEFNREEEARGKAGLRAMGIPNDEPFVCVTVRDSAYLASHYQGADTRAHNFRDSNIQNVVLAAETLADRGYYVLRMGAKVHSPIASSNPKVIDYATNGMRSDFMDVYLGAKCEFCISTSTGFDAIPLIFRRPIVYINMAHLGWLFTFRKQCLAIAKHHFLVCENRELTLNEIFSYGVGFCLNSADFQSKGVELIENTPEEIRDVVVEMAERLKGVWQPREDDEMLQRKFWEVFPVDAVNAGGVPFHGEIRSRVGADFLRNNLWWLSR